MKTEDFTRAAIGPSARHIPVQTDPHLNISTPVGEGTMRALFSDIGFFLLAFIVAGFVLGADSNAAEILHQLVH